MRMRMRKQQFALIVLVTACSCFKLKFPIGFAIVRFVDPSLQFDQFLSAIGRPTYDEATQSQIGYNLISLDGYRSNYNYSSIESQLSPLSTWKNIYQTILGSRPSLLGTSSKQIQKNTIKNIFHRNYSRLLMNVELDQNTVSTQQTNSIGLALQIAVSINQMSLDGVSIEFNDYNAVKEGTASAWLYQLLKEIKKNPLNEDIIVVLIIPPSFAVQIEICRSNVINSLVDYYVLKYFNTVKNDYTSYSSLFEQANNYPGTALFQMNKNGTAIDLCRTLIAKPMSYRSTWNPAQYVESAALGAQFMQAFSKNWFGGLANLDYRSDLNENFVNTALGQIRNQCDRQQNCIC